MGTVNNVVLLFSAILISLNFSGIMGAVPTDNSCPGTLNEVRITDCSAYPCRIQKGKEYTVEIDFIPAKNTSTLNVRCQTVYYGKSYDIPEQNICSDLKPEKCPLNNLTKYTYSVKFTVLYFVPTGEYPITCYVSDDSKTDQLCMKASGIITY